MTKILKVEIKENETIDDLILGDLKIIQKRDGFRFSLDAVLLAHFAHLKKGAQIIDLGTGTGIIPLLLSTREVGLEILGVEIQKAIAEMAQRSIALNALKQIQVINEDFRELGREHFNRYDLVISNPPYLPVAQGKISPKEEIAVARHELKCTLEDLIKAASKFMVDKGRLALIHRAERLAEIISYAKSYNLEPKRLRLIYPYLNQTANLVLVEAIKGGKPGLQVQKPLIVYNEDGSYTQEILEYYLSGVTNDPASISGR